MNSAQESEKLRTLCPAAITALSKSGMFQLWTPVAQGGNNIDLRTQIEVMTEIAWADMSSCWVTMICNSVVSEISRGLPDAGISEIFGSGEDVMAAASVVPSGVASRRTDGFIVSGNWKFGSGICHSNWIIANCQSEPSEKGQRANVLAVLPIKDVSVHDDWHATGLSGTGSHSYSVKNKFVPFHRVMDEAKLLKSSLNANPMRIPIEHASVSLGGAKRVLQEVIIHLSSKSGPLTNSRWGKEIGKLEANLEVLSAGVISMAVELENAWDNGADVGELTEYSKRLRAICALAAERCLQIAAKAIRLVGASAVFIENDLQRFYRDLIVASQHAEVSDVAYVNLGSWRIMNARSL